MILKLHLLQIFSVALGFLYSFQMVLLAKMSLKLDAVYIRVQFRSSLNLQHSFPIEINGTYRYN